MKVEVWYCWNKPRLLVSVLDEFSLVHEITPCLSNFRVNNMFLLHLHSGPSL
jgi:hypothetical protein